MYRTKKPSGLRGCLVLVSGVVALGAAVFFAIGYLALHLNATLSMIGLGVSAVTAISAVLTVIVRALRWLGRFLGKLIQKLIVEIQLVVMIISLPFALLWDMARAFFAWIRSRLK